MLKLILQVIFWVLLALSLTACLQVYRNSGATDLNPPSDDVLRGATYNVHYIILGRETGAWSVGDWERRKRPMDAAFKALDADFIGLQEAESFGGGSGGRINLKLDWLLQQNPGYAAAAVGDPAVFPSTQPILYRSARLSLLDQGWFFFSETPDVIYSRTFNGSYPAFASWAQFRDQKTGASFRIVNVHFEYSSGSNRRLSAALVAERISPWIDAGETVILIGDLNARLGARTLQILEEVGLEFATTQGSTYHFNRGINLFGAIDHFATVGAVDLAGPPTVLRQKFLGEWPTDHYPLVADFRLR